MIILVITFCHINDDKPELGKALIVSHGYDTETGTDVILQCEPLKWYIDRGLARRDPEINEYFLV